VEETQIFKRKTGLNQNCLCVVLPASVTKQDGVAGTF